MNTQTLDPEPTPRALSGGSEYRRLRRLFPDTSDTQGQWGHLNILTPAVASLISHIALGRRSQLASPTHAYGASNLTGSHSCPGISGKPML